MRLSELPAVSGSCQYIEVAFIVVTQKAQLLVKAVSVSDRSIPLG